jgi:galactosylceramidase
MGRRARVSSLLVLLAATATARAADSPAIVLDGRSPGRVFEGIGAVSAGASTRLLVDYPEAQRSQVLDYLFKPRFGAGFQHLKVEIGGGENSTCGSEPSHVLTRDELASPKPRGYEFWLMAEARKRNPDVILDCLPWTYPRWIKDRFSRDSADWFAAFLQVARRDFGLELDWIAAAQNENGTDLNWIRSQLRPTLDARGFAKVKLQAPDDDSEYWQIFDKLAKDPELDRLVQAVGYHYVDGREPWQIDQKARRDATPQAKASGKPLWASEEWSQSGGRWGDKGALYVARLMNKLYIRDRITKFEIWCPIDSIYDQIIWSDTGAMQADTPWCGHYEVWPAVWTIAHTTQFAEPGWVYVDSACGPLDPSTWKGSHVALRDPKSGDWSLIVVTGAATTIKASVGGGLETGKVHAWRSTETARFEHVEDITLNGGGFTRTLLPDAVYTFTTTRGQHKGNHGTPPPRTPFPLPYADDFEHTQPGDTPRYLSDQKGTFEVTREGRGRCVTQVVPAEGILWYGNALLKPHTLFGDPGWTDYSVEAQVLVTGGDVEVGGRYGDRNKLGYRWVLTRDGAWSLLDQDKLLASGAIAEFAAFRWHALRLEMQGKRLRGLVDGKVLADVENATRSKGMAVLASTYHRNSFDNLKVEPLRR